VAAALVTLPALLLTTQRKAAPLSARVVEARVKVDAVAPPMAAPFRCHWNVKGPLPVAPTEKVALSPTGTVTSSGWSAITGSGLLVELILRTEPFPAAGSKGRRRPPP
jgi:hypothetical protein